MKRIENPLKKIFELTQDEWDRPERTRGRA